jgi:hypothetical protein
MALNAFRIAGPFGFEMARQATDNARLTKVTTPEY